MLSNAVAALCLACVVQGKSQHDGSLLKSGRRSTPAGDLAYGTDELLRGF